MQGYENIQEKLYDKEVERVVQFNSDQVQKNLMLEQKKHEVLQSKKIGNVVEQKPEELKKESGIQIRIGETVASEQQIADIPDSENPYLFSTAGPKKVIDHGKLDAADDDLSSFDIDTNVKAAFSTVMGLGIKNEQQQVSEVLE